MAEMSALERWLVNSPFRAWLQRGEFRAFQRMAPIEPGGRLLDIGCGRGGSCRLIVDIFRPEKLSAFDIDPEQVRLAERHLGSLVGNSVDLRVADATRMPYADGEFDAVFEQGTLHHIPDLPTGVSGWKTALREVARVLKPGGVFYFAEPSQGRLTRGIYRILSHDSASMFDGEGLREGLAEAGLELRGGYRRLPLWDLVGVAVRR